MNRAQRRALQQKQFQKREAEVSQAMKQEMERRDYIAYMYAMQIVGEALRRTPDMGPKRTKAICDMILAVERERGIERLSREVEGLE